MNYLAHALLAEPYAHSLIGNLSGDLVKGSLANHDLHPQVAVGVRRHRSVDALTDAHPRHEALRALWPSPQRRYAGIVLDVIFDHFLTRHWQRFTCWSQGEFIAMVYSVLCERSDLHPPALAKVAPRWVDANWLSVYASIDGVTAVLERLSGRLRRPFELVPMLEVLNAHGPMIEAGFIEIFSDVQHALGAPKSFFPAPAPALPQKTELP